MDSSDIWRLFRASSAWFGVESVVLRIRCTRYTGWHNFPKPSDTRESAIRALKCATCICEEQGPKGQWWWHYDSVGGRVVDGYPVFSVHQHAMGPMTLFGLGEVVNQNFDKWIYKGLRWIKSNNELRYDMESASTGVIWRCIFRSRRSGSRYVKAAFGRYSNTVQHENAGDLSIVYECRPYELGWLLYAFAGRDGQDRTPAAFASRTQPGGKN